MRLDNFDFSKKIFYHPERVAELKAGKRPFPVTIEIDLTNRCNHRCSFCFYAEHISTDKSTIETEVALQLLSDLKECGAKGVSFTGGGEPMIHKDFATILEHAANIGLDCGLITNGSAITPKNVDILAKSLAWIRVSAAGGDADSYQAVQGVDHFDKVVNNIRLLQQAKIRSDSPINIGVRMLVTPRNVDSVVNFAKVLGPVGINYLQVAPDQFTNDDGAFWNSEKTQGIFKDAESILGKQSTKLLSSGYVWYQGQLDKPQSCYAHFFQIAILAEGHVAFCKNARGADKFYLGNINEKSIQQIWDDAKNLDLESWVKPSNCGLYCKHIQMNLALENVMHPEHDMSPNFVG